jgi:hypothetical protein
MIPIALPMHLQVGQSSDVESSVTVPVRTLSAWKYIRTSLDTLEREAKFVSDASACLIPTRMNETDSPHSERTEGITHQGISRFSCETLALGALADPVPGVALAALPVDVMKATPDDCFTGCSLEPNQLYAFTQDKTRHYMSISDFH